MESDFARREEQRLHTRHRVRNGFCMWWLGMINNFHYTLVLSGSTAIAESYDMKKYVTLITWANVFFGIVSRIVNAFLMPLLSYNIRVTATSVMGILAILLVSFAWDIGGHKNVVAFVVTLIGVVFIGMAGSYGEALFLGYMERMPPKQIGSWASGTGLSGVAASLIFLGLTSAGLSNSHIFLISIPVLVIYWLFYFFGLKVPFYVPVRSASITSIDEVDAQPVDGDDESGYTYKAMTNWKGMPWTNIVPAKREEKPECLKEMEREKLRAAMGDDYVEPLDSDNTPENAQIGKCARWKRDTWPMIKEMHNFTLWNNFNLAAVYVAEYAVQFMAPFSFPCDTVKTSENFWLKNSFVITQFCYQFGVLISRSSLLCLRIRYVWIMTIIQVLNAIAWFVQAKIKYMSDPNNADRELKFAFGLFAWMIFVGLMGGASYVNVFYNILKETKEMQEDEEREIVEFVTRHRSMESAKKSDEEDPQKNAKDGDLIASDGETDVGVAAGEETEELLAAHKYIAALWKEKRDLAMNIGALYATIGSTIGSLLDLLFTLVVLNDDDCGKPT
ncbi:uncharacterized protein TM35_000361290 [Trypanosoma theileri]|uniref:Battenin n=1 Tax=Trypanosoma theileri TaxID=67003 RepID=A0A1X0NM99_9TRYP|nr:uncharacterized protein TM35_000361290 [Trypanosoma theileri]ORC85269.1 hypothetical protein TM35_000361290 [Trypanosoma theileri]